MVLGDGGIIAQAELAAQMQENASTEEEQSLNELLAMYENAMEETGETTCLTGTELAARIGDYVDYTPTNGTFTASSTYSGYEEDQNLSTDTNLDWRILFADEDTLTLISDEPANNILYLEGYQGYNNAVKLLNDACETLYSNELYWATSRSIKVEDYRELI